MCWIAYHWLTGPSHHVCLTTAAISGFYGKDLGSYHMQMLLHAKIMTCKFCIKSYFILQPSILILYLLLKLINQLKSKLPNLVHWIYFNSLLTAISHYIHSSGLKHANTPVFPWASRVYDPLFLCVNIKYQEMSYINTTLPWQMA